MGLKEILKREGVSYRQFARMIGTPSGSHHYISDICNGKRTPSRKFLIRALSCIADIRNGRTHVHRRRHGCAK